MPRLSAWKEGRRTNDYKFHDRTIREMFVIGGTGINVHKYLGTPSIPGAATPTQPTYDTITETNIQDLLFLENRDRKYDTSVYNMRGIYNVNDLDFDLSQFGLFLQNDTIFVVFHINDMIDILGRKIISGDVLELPHLRDFFPLNPAIPASLLRYYVVQDASRAAEGYSQTWWPHLWRIKAIPIVDGKEYKDIFENDPNGDGTPLGDLISTYNTEIAINDAIINQAMTDVPRNGYNTDHYYTLPLNEDGSPRQGETPSADNAQIFVDSLLYTSDMEVISPKKNGYEGWLLGDGLAPNGFPVGAGITFPTAPNEGDFYLRLDYFPNRLFRWSGNKWMKIEDNVRTSQLPHYSTNQRMSFVNNDNQTTMPDGQVVPERQTLSQALAPKADE